MEIDEAIKYFESLLTANQMFGFLGKQNEVAKLALSALQAQKKAESYGQIREDLFKISEMMTSYAQDCDWGGDVCRNCQFFFFCANGFNPVRIADVTQQAAKALGASYGRPGEKEEKVAKKSKKTAGTKKRRYIRKCGFCGERNDQKDMIRDDSSPNGWMCRDCSNIMHPEYEAERW